MAPSDLTPPPDRTRIADGRRPRSWPVVGGAVGLAGLSLLLPWTLTYDSWSWVTWGREVAHLDLDTRGLLAAWKPLPVLCSTLFALAGRAAPALWLVTARAGGLLAVAMTYRLARRAGGTVAAVVAAVALLTLNGFSGYLVPLGMSEPLLAGLALWAVDRHLEGRHFQALALALAASLLRPEAWPFLGLYALWLWRAQPARRWLVATILMAVPLLWLGPDQWGAGDAFRSAHRADIPTQGGPLLTSHPGLEVLASAGRYLLVPFGVAATVAVAEQLWLVARRRPTDRATSVVTIVTVAWLALVVSTTQARASSGDQRYLIVAGAGACVLAGVGWSRVVQWGGRLVGRVSGGQVPALAGRVAVTAAVVAAAVPFATSRIHQLRRDATELRYQAHLYGALPGAVRAAGGRRRLLACGPLFSGFYQAPALAWQLGVHVRAVTPTTLPDGVRGSGPRSVALREQLARGVVTDPRPPGVVFRSRTTKAAAPAPLAPPWTEGFPLVGRVGPWEVAAACAPDQAGR